MRPETVFIYGLVDPRTGVVRYVGKAKDAEKRYKGHLRERRGYPKDNWIAKLARSGDRPKLIILEEVDSASWKDAERKWIVEYREKGEVLLNVADGGDEPHCSREQRSANAKKVTAMRESDPVAKRMWRLKNRMIQNLNFFKKRKMMTTVYRTRLMMRCIAAACPDTHGDWRNI